MKIGFFDSGLGGLTILRAVAKALPGYDYYFYGDTAHLPLGDKSPEEILEYTRAGVLHLFKNDCQLVIIACNTASADSARALQLEFSSGRYADRRILGMIIPTIEAVIETATNKLLLLGTSHTIGSGKYTTELEKLDTMKRELRSIATPELAQLIEQGDNQTAATCAINYIDAAAGDSEVIILGCTHYTEIKNPLRAYFSDKIIISQDEVIPNKLKKYLTMHPEIETVLSRGRQRNIHLTKHRSDYDLLLQQLLSGAGE